MVLILTPGPSSDPLGPARPRQQLEALSEGRWWGSEQSMAKPPHPDPPTILRALTLKIWELPSWKMPSFGDDISSEVEGAVFWSPLLQTGAPSTLAWESCSGACTSTFGVSRTGRGWEWVRVRAGQRWARGLGWDRRSQGRVIGSQGQACAHLGMGV